MLLNVATNAEIHFISLFCDAGQPGLPRGPGGLGGHPGYPGSPQGNTALF